MKALDAQLEIWKWHVHEYVHCVYTLYMYMYMYIQFHYAGLHNYFTRSTGVIVLYM